MLKGGILRGWGFKNVKAQNFLAAPKIPCGRTHYSFGVMAGWS